MEIISTPLFFRSLENLCSFDSWEKNEGMPYFEPFFVKIWWNVQCGLPFLALYSVFRVNGRTVLSISIPQPSTGNPPTLVPVKFPEMQMSPKHYEEIQTMSIYLGIYRIALFWIRTVFGRYIWLNVFVFELMYLYLYLNQTWAKYLYLYLKNPNFCTGVFVFVFDKTYLTPALIWGERISLSMKKVYLKTICLECQAFFPGTSLHVLCLINGYLSLDSDTMFWHCSKWRFLALC